MGNIRVSTHAKSRISERVQNGSFKNPERLFKNVLKDGYNPNQFDGEFMYYLKGKTKNWEYSAKIYDDNIYIHNKGVLITVLEVPLEFLPLKDHLRPVIKNREEFNMNVKELLKERPNAVRSKGKGARLFKEYDEKLFNLGYKECRRCASAKTLDQFSPSKVTWDGRHTYCKSCVRMDQRKRADKKLNNIVTTDVEIKTNIKQTDPKVYSIQAITQATSFNNYLREHNISDTDFIKFLEDSSDLSKALTVYNHLSNDSRELYISLYKKGS